MAQDIGLVTFRSARLNPAACKGRRPLLTTHPIAHDTDGRPGGVRLNLADSEGVAWIDVGRHDAEVLIAQLRAVLDSKL